MSKKDTNTQFKKNYSKSAFAELSAVSVSWAIVMFAIILASVALYVAMNIRTDKRVYITDDADIFTSRELKEIKEVSKKLSKDEDINVFVVTTRDKGDGYDNSDADCDRFISTLYKDKCIPNFFSSFRNNSGFVVYIDLTEDEPGKRYIQLYTYGTAHYEVSNDECTDILWSHRSQLQDGDYGEAVIDILKGLQGRSINNSGIGFMYGISLVIPFIIALFITWLASKNKKLDKAPATRQYKVRHQDYGDQDKFIRKSVTVTSNSSSSGGGGGFSGGGGGGHSGGSSMRF